MGYIDLVACIMGAADKRKIGKITVRVVSASNLKNKELLSKSDPYCKVRFISSHTLPWFCLNYQII